MAFRAVQSNNLCTIYRMISKLEDCVYVIRALPRSSNRHRDGSAACPGVGRTTRRAPHRATVVGVCVGQRAGELIEVPVDPEDPPPRPSTPTSELRHVDDEVEPLGEHDPALIPHAHDDRHRGNAIG